MRLFIAIDLPESWRDILAQPEISIGWLGRGVKWVDSRSTHLTLRFLGEVPESDLPKLCRAITEACDGIPSFSMRIRGTGIFPNRKRPRIYWAGVEAPNVLLRLQANIEEKMRLLGFEAEENPFHPHLTLARIKDPNGKERMTDALLNFPIESESAQVNEVLMMRSHLSPGGARYEAVSKFPLLRTENPTLNLSS